MGESRTFHHTLQCAKHGSPCYCQRAVQCAGTVTATAEPTLCNGSSTGAHLPLWAVMLRRQARCAAAGWLLVLKVAAGGLPTR